MSFPLPASPHGVVFVSVVVAAYLSYDLTPRAIRPWSHSQMKFLPEPFALKVMIALAGDIFSCIKV